MTPPSARTVRIWDLPTRVFHGCLALSVVGSIVTAKIGGNAMVWHFRLGCLALGLLAFRLLWGLVGGHWSRFSRFVYSPATMLRYLQGRTRAEEHLDVGHSPLGSLSVFGMLAILVAQVATGLVSDDEIASVGPLNKYVASATGLAATAWHKGWGADILIALALLHVAAIIFYRVRRKVDLTGPMLHGDKRLPPGTPASRDDGVSRLLALGIAALCAALVAWVMRQ